MATRRQKKEMLSSTMLAFAQKPNVDDLILVADAARVKGVSAASIFQLIQRGRLRSEKVLGRTLVYRSEIENFERQKPGVKAKSNG
jgi:hypothetical protein